MVRNNTSRLSGIATVVAASALALAACGGGDGGSGGDGSGLQLKIGMIDSLTGPTGLVGQADVCAVKVLVDAINKDNFVEGVSVDLTVIDDQTNPAAAVQAATKLTNEGVKFITGGVTGAVIQPRIPITNDAGALDTLGLAQGPAVVDSSDLTVHPGPIASQVGGTAAELVKDLDGKSVAFIAADTDYGKSSISAVKEALDPSIESMGEVLVPATQTDFSASVTKLVSMEPDVVVSFLSGSGPIIDFLKRIKSSGADVTVIGGPGTVTPNIVESAGEAGDGVYTANTYPPAETNEADEAMKAQFDKYAKGHSECKDKILDSSMATSYSGVQLIAQGAAKAKSDDPKKVQEEIVKGTWTIPPGEVTFESNGQADVPFSKFVSRDGELVPATD